MHSICQQIWKAQQWPQDWKRSVFIPIPKNGNAKNVQTTTLLYSSHMLAEQGSKFSKRGFNRTCTKNFQMYSWIWKRQRNQRSNCQHLLDHRKSKRVPEKTSTSASLTVNHNKLWKILKEMGIPDYLTCLLRNLYAGQEATVRTGHGTTDWFQIGKGVRQAYILSPCLFNFTD